LSFSSFDNGDDVDADEMYAGGSCTVDDDCTKSVAIAETTRQMQGRFGADNAPFTSGMENAFLLQVQEEFVFNS
jgi:hypothetical protein